MKWSPIVIAGIYYSEVLNPTAAISVTDPDTTKTGLPLQESIKGISMKDFRAKNNYGFLCGLGVNYYLNRFTFSIEALYSEDIKKYTKNREFSLDNNLLTDFYYIDDDFKFRSLQFSLGISYTFLYQIKKKY
jgi:hypothetical protein